MRYKLNTIGILAGFIVLVAGPGVVDSSLAALISIDNQSFETPSGAGRDGQSLYTTTSSATLYDWTFTQTGAATQLAAFIRNPAEGPTVPSFTNSLDDSSTNGVPPGGDGTNHLFISIGGTGGGTWTIWQTLSDTLQPGTYTLTAAVGYPDNRNPIDDFEIRLLAGSTVLTSYVGTGSELPQAHFEDVSVTLDVLSDSAYLGEAISIAFYASSTVAGPGEQVCFDNVRLDFAAVPEPSTLGMLVAGLIGLPWQASRKRRYWLATGN